MAVVMGREVGHEVVFERIVGSVGIGYSVEIGYFVAGIVADFDSVVETVGFEIVGNVGFGFVGIECSGFVAEIAYSDSVAGIAESESVVGTGGSAEIVHSDSEDDVAGLEQSFAENVVAEVVQVEHWVESG
jgi:hypothetical protein